MFVHVRNDLVHLVGVLDFCVGYHVFLGQSGLAEITVDLEEISTGFFIMIFLLVELIVLFTKLAVELHLVDGRSVGARADFEGADSAEGAFVFPV
jgi:hypothetical protein